MCDRGVKDVSKESRCWWQQRLAQQGGYGCCDTQHAPGQVRPYHHALQPSCTQTSSPKQTSCKQPCHPWVTHLNVPQTADEHSKPRQDPLQLLLHVVEVEPRRNTSVWQEASQLVPLLLNHS